MRFYSALSNHLLFGVRTETTGERCGDVILQELRNSKRFLESLKTSERCVLNRLRNELKKRALYDGDEAADIALDNMVTWHLVRGKRLQRDACLVTLKSLLKH